MTSRERILSAIHHKESDRVPIDLGATPSSGISLVAYQNLIQYLNRADLPSHVYDVVQEVVQPPMEILDRFGVDVIDIGRHFNALPDSWQELEVIKGYKALYPKWLKVEEGGNNRKLMLNAGGEAVGVMPQGATFFDQTIFPYQEGYPDDFSDLPIQMGRTVWGAAGFSPWDLSSEKDFWQLLRKKTIELKQQTDKALLIGIGCNLFEWGTFLRRMDNFFMDLVVEPERVHAMLDSLLEIHLENVARTCEAVGDIVDIIKFGDDLGSLQASLISPAMYDEFFKPRHKQLCDYVKAHSSMHTMLHSCGSIYNLMPKLIEAGFEIINPIQINAAMMEPDRLKREFGKDVVFWGGGCDTATILNRATPEEVKDHVRRNIECFSREGGFVFTSVHNIMPDVPPRNIIAMYEAVKEYR